MKACKVSTYRWSSALDTRAAASDRLYDNPHKVIKLKTSWGKDIRDDYDRDLATANFTASS